MHNNFSTVSIVMITMVINFVMVGVVMVLPSHRMVVMMPISYLNLA
jgi:hypothetical protein